MNSLNDYSIESILPPSLKQDSFVIALAKAFEKEIKEAYREAESLSDLMNVDNLPEKLLDFLAYEKHVDFYDQSLTIDKKRDLIKNSSKWHNLKGTPAAIEGLLSAAFDDSNIEEWFEYNGEPYKFKIKTTDRIPSTDKLNKLIDAVNSIKNVRSSLESLTIQRGNNLNNYSAFVIHSNINQLLDTDLALRKQNNLSNYYTGIIQSNNSKTINTKLINDINKLSSYVGGIVQICKTITITTQEV